MNFTKSNYKTLLQLIKPHIIDLHTPGNGVILRHDVDLFLEKSFQMAVFEHEMGIKSTYFILNTANYWSENEDLFQILRDIEGMGHEIGWHNNAISESISTGKTVKECIETPLKMMREAGLWITTTASHGDPLCHEFSFINYNVFGMQAKGFEGYKGEVFTLSDFGLEIEAYHNRHTLYMSESHGAWPTENDKTLEKFLKDGGRLQVLIHPEWWKI